MPHPENGLKEPESLRGYELVQAYVAPARHGVAFPVNTMDRLQIIDVRGKQVADLVAFTASDWSEYLSPGHTVTQNWSIQLKPGYVLASNRRNDLFRLLEDTVGYHDLVVPCCDPEAYFRRYGLRDHRSCRVNLEEAFAAKGQSPVIRGENAWNIFMKTEIGADGALVYLEPTHDAGSYIVLEALVDLWVGLSACPQDQTPTNGFCCTELSANLWRQKGSYP